jgi:hypothetical protein
MGAQGDFIAERFVPSEQYKAQQMAMAQNLAVMGVGPEQLEEMFFMSTNVLSGKKPKDEKPKDR